MITEDLIAALRGRTTVLSVTHRPEVAARADRVLYLYAGRIGGFCEHEALLNASAAYRAHWGA